MSTLSTQEFDIKEALLDADREFRNLGTQPLEMEQPIDLRTMIGEINLFESIDKGYVTGKIAVMDDLGLFSEIIELQGTETLKLTLVGLEEDAKGFEVTIDLRIVSILEQERINDRAAVFVINCVSNHMFANASANVCRSYTGHLEDIASKVLKSYLDVDLEKKEEYIDESEKSVQGPVKIIVPNISPLETLDWLTERASGPEGSPYFAWASMWDQDDGGKIRLGAFKTMLHKGIERAKDDDDLQFFFSINAPSTDPLQKNNRKQILNFEHSKIENTLEMIQGGVVGAAVNNLDTFTSNKIYRHFSLAGYLDNLSDATGVEDAFRTILDREAKLTVNNEEKTLSEFEGQGPDMLTSYGTYEWNNSYHDVADAALLQNKIRKSAVMAMLGKNRIDITVPGYTFFDKRLSVGDIVRIKFQTHLVDTDDDVSNKHTLDERTSGYYMLISTRHMFSGNMHRVVFSAAKVADNF